MSLGRQVAGAGPGANDIISRKRVVGAGRRKFTESSAKMDAYWNSLKKTISDDSMSIMLFSLFLLCLIGQGLSGWLAYNQSLRAGHFPAIALGSYLGTGNFLDGMLSNWQAGDPEAGCVDRFQFSATPKGRRPFTQDTTPQPQESRLQAQPSSDSARVALRQLVVIGVFRHVRRDLSAARFIRRVEVQRKSGAPPFGADFVRRLCRVIELLVFGFPVLGSRILGDRCLHHSEHIPATGELTRVKARGFEQ